MNRIFLTGLKPLRRAWSAVVNLFNARKCPRCGRSARHMPEGFWLCKGPCELNIDLCNCWSTH